MSEPLTFGELHYSCYFVAFPKDGDDAGHGGYRGEHMVFKKAYRSESWRRDPPPLAENAYAIGTGKWSHFTSSMQILQLKM